MNTSRSQDRRGFFSERDCGFPALDGVRTHIDAILARSFGEAAIP
jgi:hypothetical protein